MDIEATKRKIADFIRSNPLQFREKRNGFLKINSFESLNILDLNVVDKENFKYEFSGTCKIQIIDEITDGGAYYSPSRSKIEGSLIILKGKEIMINEPIIIENL
ncbi:hypothetical protein EZS27_021775 [termite gut metagenome]|uniref:Uncharacterized protein n=1 Tax=termite gut metagenome TaxID=433724 RepID=A0A5J4R6S1_9ZZZZ